MVGFAWIYLDLLGFAWIGGWICLDRRLDLVGSLVGFGWMWLDFRVGAVARPGTNGTNGTNGQMGPMGRMRVARVFPPQAAFSIWRCAWCPPSLYSIMEWEGV